MIDLKDFVTDLISKATIPEKANMVDISLLLVDNDWFGIQPTIIDNAVMLTTSQCDLLRKPIETFLSTPRSCTYFITELYARYPITTKKWEKFAKEEKLIENDQIQVLNFLLFRLKKEIPLYNDKEMTELLAYAIDDLAKGYGDLLTFFIAWVRSNTKTAYYRDYIMEKRYTLGEKNCAYSLDEFLELCYRLFNEEYLEENNMYAKAAESKNYTDTWLYLSLHFICSLRYTDLERIYHPRLPYSPEETIEKIRGNIFTAMDAQEVLLSITQELALLPLTPQKTDGTQGVGSIKLTIPFSCELHFGILFALAEAHRQLAGVPEEPIVRRITTYEQISRYMGDEIGELFLEANFRPRSATKSYLQAIFFLADDILAESQDGPNIKGYLLAALARSHKGAYGEFASTTFTYLKDAKFSGLTPEFVAFELLERGVLSFAASSLLRIVTNDEFSFLTIQQQTSMIKALNMLPSEINSVVSICESAKNQSELVVKEALASDSDILSVLHKIGSGEAYSKQANSLCLLTATKKLCPHMDSRQCVGCKYEISTKSTFFFLISEYKRMLNLYNTVADQRERNKYQQIVVTIILPKMNEMLNCIRESYGQEVYIQYENFLKENLS